MARVESSIVIQASPKAVFDFVCILPRIPEYVPIVREIFDITPGPVKVGTTYMERAKPGPFETVQVWRCTEFDRPQRQVYAGKGRDMTIVLTKTFAPVDGGTLYSQSLDFRFLPQVRPIGWVMERLVVRRKMAAEFEKIVVRIKQLVEAEQQEARAGKGTVTAC